MSAQPLMSVRYNFRGGLRAFTAPYDSWRIPEPSLDQISPKLQTAVLTYADRGFYYHFGINPISMVQAGFNNIKARRVVRDGSTITIQVARMMEPKDRTIRNKLIEMFRYVSAKISCPLNCGDANAGSVHVYA